MSARSPSSAPVAPTLSRAHERDWALVASLALLSVAILAVYARTFSVPLLLDDHSSIQNNPTLRHLGSAFFPPREAGVGGRPLLNLSFALNQLTGGSGLAGFHLVNLLIHVAAAWTLFALIRQTLRRPPLAARFASASTALAFVICALWALDPLQTESVTYLSQRAESLMGVFYLLTLYCFIRGVDAGSRAGTRLYFGLGLAACFAGTATKEVIVTAPVAVFLYDGIFLSGSFPEAWRRHRAMFIGLASSWIPLGISVLGLGSRNVGFGQGLTAWGYALTESRVGVKYLALSLWPHPLVFDYGMSLPSGFPGIGTCIVIWAFLLLGLIALWRHSRPAAFAFGWFFLLLAPTSSVVPIAGQPMAESRLYLPLAGVLALIALSAFAWAGRKSLVFLFVVAGVFGATSYLRNLDYMSEEGLWRDTLAKAPGNARAYNNLGYTLAGEGRLDEAVTDYEAALHLLPDYAEAHNNLGDALSRLAGRQDEAITQFQDAVRLKPDFTMAHYNLGTAFEHLPGRQVDAARELMEAVQRDPSFAQAHYNLGTDLDQIPGKTADAQAEYREALRLDPDLTKARINLANSLAGQGRLDQAAGILEEAIQREPASEEAHYDLANTLKKLPGKREEAIQQFEEALRLKPAHVEAHNNLGTALFAAGRTQEAILQYDRALQLDPRFTLAHFNLALALSQSPAGVARAEAEVEAVLAYDPGNEPAEDLLAKIKAASLK